MGSGRHLNLREVKGWRTRVQRNPGNLRGRRTHRTRNQTLTVLTQPFYYLWSSSPQNVDTREDLTNPPCVKLPRKKKKETTKLPESSPWTCGFGVPTASSDVHFGKE